MGLHLCKEQAGGEGCQAYERRRYRPWRQLKQLPEQRRGTCMSITNPSWRTVLHAGACAAGRSTRGTATPGMLEPCNRCTDVSALIGLRKKCCTYLH